MIKKPYMIAEIGINHNGDLNLTKKLIDIAIENKFDAVKFQKRDIELVYSKEILDTLRESPWVHFACPPAIRTKMYRSTIALVTSCDSPVNCGAIE